MWTKVCPGCGKTVPTIDPACPHCSHRFGGAGASDAKAARADKVARKWIGGVVGVVGLAMVGAILTEDPAKRLAREKDREKAQAQERRQAEAERQQAAEAKVAEQKSGFHCLSGWDGHSRQVRQAMLSTLRDPDSFEEIETRITPIDKAGKHALILKYRARNGFGGMNVGTALFSIDGATCAATLIGNDG